MALRQREKVLASATVAMVVVVGLVLLVRSGGFSVGDLRETRDALKKEVDDLTKQVRGSTRARRQLAAWRERALPQDASVARPLYNDWLVDVVEEVGLQKQNIKPGAENLNHDFYTMLPFTIEGQGTLEQLTQFLYKFYSAGYLHKVKRLTAKPIEGTRNMKLNLTVEVLGLPDAKYTDRLPEDPPSLLKHDAEEYRNTIVDRIMEGDRSVYGSGLFAEYVSPPPPRESFVRQQTQETPVVQQPRRGFDHTRETYVSGISEVNGVKQVWLRARTLGRSYVCTVGDMIEVGDTRLRIAQIRIDERDVVIESESDRRRVSYGQSLARGTSIRN